MEEEDLFILLQTFFGLKFGSEETIGTCQKRFRREGNRNFNLNTLLYEMKLWSGDFVLGNQSRPSEDRIRLTTRFRALFVVTKAFLFIRSNKLNKVEDNARIPDG